MIISRIIIIGVPLFIAALAVWHSLAVEEENRRLRSFLDRLAAQARQSKEIDKSMQQNLDAVPAQNPGRKY